VSDSDYLECECVNAGDVYIQSSFQRMMTEIYEQEHVTMMNIIDDARRSLALTVDELHDEQQVLSLTADKICKSSTRRTTSAQPHRRQDQ